MAVSGRTSCSTLVSKEKRQRSSQDPHQIVGALNDSELYVCSVIKLFYDSINVWGLNVTPTGWASKARKGRVGEFENGVAEQGASKETVLTGHVCEKGEFLVEKTLLWDTTAMWEVVFVTEINRSREAKKGRTMSQGDREGEKPILYKPDM
jgi:hypothetical protein